MTRFALAAVLLAACGGDDGGGALADAPRSDTGGSANKVMAVTCPTTADAMVTISAGGMAYSPAAQNVPKNAVVKFVMTATHNTAPNPQTTTDPGLTVGFGETKCLKFTETGTFGFYCSAHGFAGTITVQ